MAQSCVCLLSVRYVLQLNGTSYQKTAWRSKQGCSIATLRYQFRPPTTLTPVNGGNDYTAKGTTGKLHPKCFIWQPIGTYQHPIQPYHCQLCGGHLLSQNRGPKFQPPKSRTFAGFSGSLHYKRNLVHICTGSYSWLSSPQQQFGCSTQCCGVCVLGALGGLACGSAAGMCAKVAVYPLDMIKKRLQMEGFQYGRVVVGSSRRYHGFVHCARQIITYEGVRALYKGLWPSVLKAFITTGLHFSTYEHCLAIIRRVYQLTLLT